MERERIRQRILHALEALSERLAAAGRFADAVEAAMLATSAERAEQAGSWWSTPWPRCNTTRDIVAGDSVAPPVRNRQRAMPTAAQRCAGCPSARESGSVVQTAAWATMQQAVGAQRHRLDPLPAMTSSSLCRGRGQRRRDGTPRSVLQLKGARFEARIIASAPNSDPV